MAGGPQRVINERTGAIIATHVRSATGPLGSLKGLMFQKELLDGHGLRFSKVTGVHTNFMRFPIDILFLDEQQRVKHIKRDMPPWRLDFSRAAGMIELPAGTAQRHDIQITDQLRFEPA